MLVFQHHCLFRRQSLSVRSSLPPITNVLNEKGNKILHKASRAAIHSVRRSFHCLILQDYNKSMCFYYISHSSSNWLSWSNTTLRPVYRRSVCTLVVAPCMSFFLSALTYFTLIALLLGAPNSHFHLWSWGPVWALFIILTQLVRALCLGLFIWIFSPLPTPLVLLLFSLSLFLVLKTCCFKDMSADMGMCVTRGLFSVVGNWQHYTTARLSQATMSQEPRGWMKKKREFLIILEAARSSINNTL